MLLGEKKWGKNTFAALFGTEVCLPKANQNGILVQIKLVRVENVKSMFGSEYKKKL